MPLLPVINGEVKSIDSIATWKAERARLDYLETVPKANTKQTALIEHLRNGKTSPDERIAVVISNSSGVGGSMPSSIPYDLDKALAARVPKQLVLVTPTHDRFAPLDTMDAAVEAIQHRYAVANTEDKPVRVSPKSYNHFDETMQSIFIEAMKPLIRR